MLKLYDSSHNPLGNLVKYKDCKKESEAATGDATLSFTYLAQHHDIWNEYYVRTKNAEYTVKEVNEDSDGFPQIVAVLNLEDLQRDSWESYQVTDATISEAAQPLLERVGWSVGECSITKRRNAAMVQVTTLGIVQSLCTAFMCEPVFDNLRRTVSFYEERGEDKGVYFMQGLNLRRLDRKNNSYDYYTQIIPIGADGLTIEGVNGGKKYLENYQYSGKVLPYIWKDESYTDAQALMEDAELKLKDLSRPAVSYGADVIDLAKQNSRYSILSYSLGDRVTLIDRRTGTREAQRIVRMVEHEKNPEKNTCELANTVLTFEELQERLQAAADIVNNTMTSDGKIHVSDILNWEKGIEESQTVSSIKDRVSRVTAVSYNGTPPVDAEAGDIWYDQKNGNKPHQYDGEEWQEEQFGGEALEDKAVTEPKISDQAVTAGKIAANAVTAEKINAKAVTAEKVDSGAITTEKLAANAVTAQKIDTNDLFAQDITATGTIRGVNLVGAKGTFSGSLEAATGTFSGSLSAAKGTFAGNVEIQDGNGHVKITKSGIEIKQNSTVTYERHAVYAGQGGSGSNINGTVYTSQADGKICRMMGGNLLAQGEKSRIVRTDDYDDRLLYCYEMPSPMFGDSGQATIGEDGECYICLDDVFSETVSAEIEYQTFLQKEGAGDLWVDSKNPAFFVVRGTPGLRFAWEIKAKQRDYEFDRLEHFWDEQDDLIINYEQQYEAEIEALLREREGIAV